jgi:hypothetical protein
MAANKKAARRPARGFRAASAVMRFSRLGAATLLAQANGTAALMDRLWTDPEPQTREVLQLQSALAGRLRAGTHPRIQNRP